MPNAGVGNKHAVYAVSIALIVRHSSKTKQWKMESHYQSHLQSTKVTIMIRMSPDVDLDVRLFTKQG